MIKKFTMETFMIAKTILKMLQRQMRGIELPTQLFGIELH
jgi:hypothetical protein